MKTVLQSNGLERRFGDKTAVDRVDWQLPQGTACALLGPNGAGKSTLLRMLLGLTPVSAGECRLLGASSWTLPPETRARVAFVAEQNLLPSWMRVSELMHFHRRLYPNWRQDREKEIQTLWEVPLESKVGQLSKGQQRRFALALALAQDPELLILDEPGSGLDVAARRLLLKQLADFLSDPNRSLVFSTHIVTDVERIASHVAVMDQGTLVAFEPLETLQEQIRRLRMPTELWKQNKSQFEQGEILKLDVGDLATTVVIRNVTKLPQEALSATESFSLPLEDIFLAMVRGSERA
ncbi:MAG: ABC transporter ATP-binding protein [Planctomycetota bacterium]|nr:MAG: ABC transporter ATP-binding protein [Planctomycetota bacterium]